MAKANKGGFSVLNTINIKPSKLVFTDKFRGRHKPVNEDDTVALADSIRATGQQQPIQVRMVEGTDTAEVVFGNTRGAAGLLIQNGYMSGKKEVKPNPDFTLRAEVVDCTDDEAFARNVTENAVRNATSAIDNAKNQQTLRETYGLSDVKIADLYGYTGSAMCTRYKKLLNLPEFIQDAIHTGNMTASAGFLLGEAKDIADANAWEEVWAKVKSDNDAGEPGIGSSQIVAAMKEWRKEQKEKNAPTTTPEGGEQPTGEGGTGEQPTGEQTTGEPVYALTLKKYKDILEATAGDERCPPVCKEYCLATLEVLAGKREFKDYAKQLMNWFGEEMLPAPEKAPEAPAATTEPTMEELNASKHRRKGRKQQA